MSQPPPDLDIFPVRIVLKDSICNIEGEPEASQSVIKELVWNMVVETSFETLV